MDGWQLEQQPLPENADAGGRSYPSFQQMLPAKNDDEQKKTTTYPTFAFNNLIFHIS